MVNELNKVELTNGDGFPRRFTVASNVAITKYTLLSLKDARLAAASAVENEACAGVAAMAKSATDYSTSISVLTDGVFEAVSSGTATAGEACISAGVDNLVKVAPVETIAGSGSAIIGYYMEDASDQETVNIRIRL